VGDGLGEVGEGAAQGGALPVEDAHGEQRHAGALAAEGQVEPRPPQPRQPQQPQVGAPLAAGHQLLGRQRGHLGVRRLHPGRVGGRGLVVVALVAVEVKGLLAVAPVQTGALHHGEADLHVHHACRAARDPAGPQPIGGRAVRRADLIGPHAGGLLVQATQLLPLHGGRG